MAILASQAGCGETERLEALARYDVLDTPPEEAFDRITRLACRLFGVPMSTVTFLDGHRQWFKSRQGLPDPETPRGPALCNVAIRGVEPLVIRDAAADPRFRDNPFVTGAPHIRFYAGAVLLSPDRHAVGTFCVMDVKPRDFTSEEEGWLRDLAALTTTVLELRINATTDSLTGLRARRAFREEAERTVALALRHRQDLSCLMIDLDRFKAVNDRHGHAVGDAVLRAVADALEEALRSSDILGRVGGEEFAALLPMTDAAAAADVAERVRAAVARVRVPSEAGPIATSASFGISSLDHSVGGLDDLLSRADLALYRAKEDGRNCWRAWQADAAPMPPALRRRVFKAGRIVFNSGRSTIDCTVRGLSDSDASLDVITSAGIPDAFKLQIDADKLSRSCRIVSKAERKVEVAFQ